MSNAELIDVLLITYCALILTFYYSQISPFLYQQVAPFNTYYPQLGEHLAKVGVDPAINKWDQPFVLGVVDPHDSLSHPAGVSDVQAESAARLDPDLFTNFMVHHVYFGPSALLNFINIGRQIDEFIQSAPYYFLLAVLMGLVHNIAYIKTHSFILLALSILSTALE